MGFIEAIAETAAEGLVPCEYRLTVLGKRCVYAEGVRCVKSFSEEEILLGLNRGCIKISGSGMQIEKFCDGDVQIRGSVVKIERLSV